MGMQSAVCDAIEQVKKLDARLDPVQPRAAVDNAVNVTACVRRAVESKSQHDAVAREAGYDPSFWARVLTNERGIVLERLGRISLEVQRQIVIEWGAALGLQIERRDTQAKRVLLDKLAETALALKDIV